MLLSNFIVIDYIVKILCNLEPRENKSPSVVFRKAGLCPSVLFTVAQTAGRNSSAHLTPNATLETLVRLPLLSVSRSRTDHFPCNRK